MKLAGAGYPELTFLDAILPEKCQNRTAPNENQ